MALTFYKSVAKESKLKVKKFWRLIPTFTGKKLAGGGFLTHSSWIGLMLNIYKEEFDQFDERVINNEFKIAKEA